MTKQTKYCLATIMSLQLLAFLFGCGRSALEKKPWSSTMVEVAPGNFIEISERYISSDDGKRPIGFQELHISGSSKKNIQFTETFEILIPWKGTNVHWRGTSAPVNLRAFTNRLYLITLDRVSVSGSQPEFKYFAQDKDDLTEISPSNYPKAIAGQNLDFGNRYVMGMTEQLDTVELALNQDVHDIYFRSSLTAYIWNHLTTGEQYGQSSMKGLIDESLLEGYVRTNNPVKLTAIIKDEPPFKKDDEP